MPFTYEYPRPAVTADAIILRKNGSGNEILLIKRAQPPFQDWWALPGGFLDMEETLEECIAREVAEELGLTQLHFNQFETFSTLGRDPRQRTVSTVFLATTDMECAPTPGSDAKEALWFDLRNLPPLAFDHLLIIQKAALQLSL